MYVSSFLKEIQKRYIYGVIPDSFFSRVSLVKASFLEILSIFKKYFEINLIRKPVQILFLGR